MNLRHSTVRFTFRFTLRLIAAALPLAIMALALDCFAQTLADIARKERERQKQAQPAVTLTSRPLGTASVSSAGAAATVPAVVPAPPAQAAAQKPAGPVDNQGRDEKYWRELFQKTRDASKRAEDRVQIMDLRVKELKKQLYQNTSIYNRETQLGPEIIAAQNDLEAARLEVELGRQRILSLEDELRRAGGLPGWAR